jgi:hypothetical protein
MALAAVSCTKAELKGNNDGVGILNVEMDLSALTKAALSEDELKNTAKVNIYYADKSGLVRSYTYAEMPSPFYLAAGEYRVDVLAGESVKISGFGTFVVHHKNERMGRNPKTLEEAVITSRKSLSFKASPIFKALINESK